MEKEELIQFVQWLPTKVKELKGKSPEEIVKDLNELSKTEEGMRTISGLIEQFKQEQSTDMFKKGGKLSYIINRFQKGGGVEKPKKVGKLNYVQGRTSIPAGMDQLDYNNVFSDGYRASQYSNKKGDLLQILQQPNTTNGTERRITNNLRDTTYVITNNGAKYENKKLPWYNPKENEVNRKKQYKWLTERLSNYFPNKNK